jgi:hypothetical protein
MRNIMRSDVRSKQGLVASGSSVVQRAEHGWPREEVAIKFFLSREVFEQEVKLYTYAPPSDYAHPHTHIGKLKRRNRFCKNWSMSCSCLVHRDRFIMQGLERKRVDACMSVYL